MQSALQCESLTSEILTTLIIFVQHAQSSNMSNFPLSNISATYMVCQCHHVLNVTTVTT